MAETLSGVADLSQDELFTRRVGAAMVRAALEVAAEQEVPGSARQAIRRDLAVRLFQDLAKYTPVFAIAVAADPEIVAESADAEIQSTVDAVWDAIAGAPPVPAVD